MSRICVFVSNTFMKLLMHLRQICYSAFSGPELATTLQNMKMSRKVTLWRVETLFSVDYQRNDIARRKISVTVESLKAKTVSER